MLLGVFLLVCGCGEWIFFIDDEEVLCDLMWLLFDKFGY